MKISNMTIEGAKGTLEDIKERITDSTLKNRLDSLISDLSNCLWKIPHMFFVVSKFLVVKL